MTSNSRRSTLKLVCLFLIFHNIKAQFSMKIAFYSPFPGVIHLGNHEGELRKGKVYSGGKHRKWRSACRFFFRIGSGISSHDGDDGQGHALCRRSHLWGCSQVRVVCVFQFMLILSLEKIRNSIFSDRKKSAASAPYWSSPSWTLRSKFGSPRLAAFISSLSCRRLLASFQIDNLKLFFLQRMYTNSDTQYTHPDTLGSVRNEARVMFKVSWLSYI